MYTNLKKGEKRVSLRKTTREVDVIYSILKNVLLVFACLVVSENVSQL